MFVTLPRLTFGQFINSPFHLLEDEHRLQLGLDCLKWHFWVPFQPIFSITNGISNPHISICSGSPVVVALQRAANDSSASFKTINRQSLWQTIFEKNNNRSLNESIIDTPLERAPNLVLSTTQNLLVMKFMQKGFDDIEAKNLLSTAESNVLELVVQRILSD